MHLVQHPGVAHVGEVEADEDTDVQPAGIRR